MRAYPASPIGLGKLTAFQTEMIAMSCFAIPDAAISSLVRERPTLAMRYPGMPFQGNIFQQRNSIRS